MASDDGPTQLPQQVSFTGELALRCAYGENAWQAPAGLFSTRTSDPLALDQFGVVQGVDPSYNNLCDLDRLLQAATHIAAIFEANTGNVPFIAIGVKHGNPCGASISTSRIRAIEGMVTGDSRALFGGLVMLNFPLDQDLAEILLTHQSKGRRVLDGVVVPEVSVLALDSLKRKGDKCRIFVNPALASLTLASLDVAPRFRYVRGGILVQPNYTRVLTLTDPEVQHYGTLTPRQHHDLLLAWAVCATSNSNTITIVNNGMLIGNGVGQQDRVGAAELALKRAHDAGHATRGSVAVGDSFFPFPDAVERLLDGGVEVIQATSGSIRDEEIKGVCAARGATLIHVPDKYLRIFFH